MPGTLHTVAFGPPATALLGELVAGARGGDPFAPVSVVAPSASAGTTLRRRLATDLGGLVNVAFVSFPQLAERLAGAADAGASPVPPVVARAHLRALLRESSGLAADPQVAASAATERALAVTFAELAPLPAVALDRLAAVGPAPAAVVDLFRRHRALAGDPEGKGAAWRAAIRLGSGDADVEGLGPVVVHLPRRFGPGEVELLAALAARTTVDVVVGRTGDPDADVVADELVAALGAFLPATVAHAPPPAGGPVPTTVAWVPDPAEEAAVAVRQVVAAITGTDGEAPVRPERIAVAYRMRDPYAGLLHAALDAAEVPHHVAAVTTLAQSVPGRVVLSLVDVAGGLGRREVAALWRSSPLVDPAGGGRVPASRWHELARRAGVTGGAEQWRQRLELAIEGRLERWRLGPAGVDPGEPADLADPGAAGTEVAEAIERSVRDLRAMAAHVDWLATALTPPAPASWAAWSAWLLGVLDALLHPDAHRRQPDAVTAVEGVLRGLGALDGIEPPPTLDRLRRVLEPELDRPDRAHGRFGHGVLVGRLVDVVGADLDLVVVVGAAEGRFPPRRRDDPLLPDRVRAAAGGALGPRGLRREEEHRDHLAAVAAGRRCWLVGHRSDPREQRARQPAPWFVAACAALAGEAVASADLDALRAHPWYVEVPSFEAGLALAGGPAGPAELDLTDLLADHRRGQVTTGVVAADDPELARGLLAATVRRRGRFDEWSGNVGAAEQLGAGLDRPLSPTSLEHYAACPFRYFLRSVLRVDAIDDPTDAELISALDEGSLVHEVLEGFVAGALGKPADEPWSDAERQRLRAIVEDVGRRFEGEGRTGRQLLWQVRLEQIQRQLLGVLDRDEALRATAGVAPAEVELAFGDAGAPPVSITLANGRTVAFKGYIDRVDRSPDGRRLVVYDYKTGSPRTFEGVARSIAAGDVTASGTKLQLPIYALAAEARFPGAEEVSAHYWFVGRKGSGTTVGARIDQAVKDRFRAVLELVVEGIEAGRFPANPGREEWAFGAWTHANCSWCDFDRVCPTTRGEAWVQVRTDPSLARYVELAEGPAEDGVEGGAADGTGVGT
jgi:RecB family exonuclease